MPKSGGNMKKGRIVLLLLVIVSSFVFLNFNGRPNDWFYVVNKRNEAVYINAEFRPEMEFESDDGEKYYSLHYLNEFFFTVGGGIGADGYNYTYKLGPGDQKVCFTVNLSHGAPYKGGAYGEFMSLGHPEQLKAIYAQFSVKDGNGREILNLDTIQPEDFIVEPYPSRAYSDVSSIYLIIK
jgi:hypothetical protein